MAAKPKRKPVGISPKLLQEQVLNTAPWAPAITPQLPAVAVLERAPELEARWKNGEDTEEYFVLLLAAHFTTVATFVPTDVDQRIRALTWAPLSGRRLASAVDRTLEVATWDMRPVSERTVTLGKETLAGHHGEWLSVMAGALGRALALGDQPVVERATAFIEAELAREAKLVQLARKKKTDDRTLLAVVTTVAHNLGDLSRVVDTWKPEHADSELGLGFRRLGHEGGSLRFGDAFAYSGDLNKRLMALENHRFLPLRVPRALRRSRELLLPFGPYFFDWGRTIATTPVLDNAERAEVLLALLRIHERRAEELGCLRAIAGMHDAFEGGVDRLAKLLPAHETSTLRKPAVRDAIRTPEKDFLRDFHAAITR